MQRSPLPPEVVQGIRAPRLPLSFAQQQGSWQHKHPDMGQMMSHAPVQQQQQPQLAAGTEAAAAQLAHMLLQAKVRSLGAEMQPQLVADVDAAAQQLLAAMPHLQSAPYHEVGPCLGIVAGVDCPIPGIHYAVPAMPQSVAMQHMARMQLVPSSAAMHCRCLELPLVTMRLVGAEV